MPLLNDSLANFVPLVERGVNTPYDQLRFAGKLIGATVADAKRTTVETYNAHLNRAGKFGRAIWAAVITGYTLADDIPSGAAFSTIESAASLPYAVGAISIGASALAGGLAHTQVRRMENAAQVRGVEPLIERNRRLGTDLLSVFGMGAPATTALYPNGTRPTNRRIAAMSAFYGGVGQGLTYATALTAGELAGVSPRVAVATAIGGVLTHRFAREAMNDPVAVLNTLGQPYVETRTIPIENIVISEAMPLTVAS